MGYFWSKPKKIPEYHFDDSTTGQYIVVFVTANIIEICVYPLDLIQTRLELQDEIINKLDHPLRESPYRGTFQTLKGIVKEEGFLHLWRGIPMQILRHGLYTSPRIVGYAYLKNHVFIHKKDGLSTMQSSLISGMISGVGAAFLGTPTDVAKIFLQMEGRRRSLQMNPRVSSSWGAFKAIYAIQGIKGLWRGTMPNAYRSIILNVGDLTASDIFKTFIIRDKIPDGFTSHMASGLFGGLVSAVLSTPIDITKTRMMNQPINIFGRGLLYDNTVDCIRKTIENEGVRGLYKGFIPNCLRSAPWSMAYYFIYQETNSFLTKVEKFRRNAMKTKPKKSKKK